MSKIIKKVFRKEVIAIFVLLVMVLSVLGIWKGSTTSSNIEYNGFQFYQSENGWMTRINGQPYVSFVLPSEVDNISSVKINFGSKVYVAYDPTEINISSSYYVSKTKALILFLNKQGVESCIKEKDCPSVLPIVNCDNSSSDIIYFKYANETSITKQGMCYVVSAQNNDQLSLVSEHLFYKLLGIIKNE